MATTPTAYERELEANRARKKRYTGTCENCGGVTRYAGKKNAQVSPICAKCAPTVYDYRARSLHKGPQQARLVSYLTEERRFSAIRDHLGLSSAHAAVLLKHSIDNGLIVRVSRGLYRLP